MERPPRVAEQVLGLSIKAIVYLLYVVACGQRVHIGTCHITREMNDTGTPSFPTCPKSLGTGVCAER